MTFTLELTPEEEIRIQEAQAQGFDVETIVRRLLADLPSTPQNGAEEPEARLNGQPPVSAENMAIADLIQRWRKEDMTEEEDALAQQNAQQEALKMRLARTQPPNSESLALLALLKQWREEDMTRDEEELARRDAELEEFKRNINANRALNGEEPVY